MQPPLYYWRDTNGLVEADCIIDHGVALIPLEVKSNQLISSSYFEGLENFNTIVQMDVAQSCIVYAGDRRQTRSKGTVVDWKSLGRLVDEVENKLDILR